jgi:hypothetical protein
MAALLAAPATWAAETVGHATSSTFPTGGPASASIGGPGGFGGGGRGSGRFGGRGPGGFAFRGSGGPGVPGAPGAAGAAGGFAPPAGSATGGFGRAGGFGPGGGGFAAGGGGVSGGDSASLTAAVRYAKAHGGGTIGVSSQSTAAAAMLASDANVAGLGGFSGRESSVTAAWIAMEVRDGHLRWVLADDGQGFQGPRDTRTGSQAALAVVEKTCPSVTFMSSGGTKVTMYDCQGHAAAILAASTK